MKLPKYALPKVISHKIHNSSFIEEIYLTCLLEHIFLFINNSSRVFYNFHTLILGCCCFFALKHHAYPMIEHHYELNLIRYLPAQRKNWRWKRKMQEPWKCHLQSPAAFVISKVLRLWALEQIGYQLKVGWLPAVRGKAPAHCLSFIAASGVTWCCCSSDWEKALIVWCFCSICTRAPAIFVAAMKLRQRVGAGFLASHGYGVLVIGN